MEMWEMGVEKDFCNEIRRDVQRKSEVMDGDG